MRPDNQAPRNSQISQAPSTSGINMKAPSTSGTHNEGFIRDKREVKPQTPQVEKPIELTNRFHHPNFVNLQENQPPQTKLTPIFATIKEISASQLKSIIGSYKQVINLKYTANNTLKIQVQKIRPKLMSSQS